MGEGTTRVDTESQKNGSAPSPRQAAEQLQGEIEALREELGPLVAEVDRRRHEMVDVKLQLRRHAWQVAAGAAGLAVVVAGIVWLGVRRASKQRRLLYRAARLREGVARLIEHPQRVAPDPSLSRKLLTAAATAAVGAAATKGMERMVSEALRLDRHAAGDRAR
jgi:hypothetical protein